MDHRIGARTNPVDPTDWDALARYLAGESPDEEAQRIRRWIEADPARAERVAVLERSMDRLAPPPLADVDVEAALRRIRARIAEDGVIPLRRAPAARVALRAAAVVLVLVGAALLLARLRPESASPVAAARLYQTGIGQQDTISLPDGTTVVLGPASRLEVAAGYGSAERTVDLAGQAFFRVTPDEARPFAVRAGGAVVRDLGTAFAVQTRSEQGVRVAVTEGTVLLHGAGEPGDRGVVLRAGDRGVHERFRGASAERGADLAAELAWTRGALVFDDEPLAEVAGELRRWYGIDLRVDHPGLRDRHLTATFQGETPAELARVIALALGAEATLRGDTLVLRSSGAGGGR